MATGNSSGVRITGKGLDELLEAAKLLVQNEVLVGFPEDTTDRDTTDEQKERGITNAALGYIHDHGAPEVNIPQREFMAPGIEDAQEAIANKLGQGMKAVLRGGGAPVVEQCFLQVGLIAEVAIKKKINEGIPPPLADATLKARAKKGRKNGAGARKGALQELDRRWDAQTPSTEFAKPLVDTAQMRNAVTFVVRSRKKRS